MSSRAARYSRRDMLRALVRPASLWMSADAMRPPYCADERLLSRCRTCADKPCIAACPETIITADSAGVPQLDFSRRGCTYCDECAVACGQGVLSPATSAGIRGQLTLDTGLCLGWLRTLCLSCKEICPEQAVVTAIGLEPQVDATACTRCGQCIAVCPVQALELNPRERA